MDCPSYTEMFAGTSDDLTQEDASSRRSIVTGDGAVEATGVFDEQEVAFLSRMTE